MGSGDIHRGHRDRPGHTGTGSPDSPGHTSDTCAGSPDGCGQTGEGIGGGCSAGARRAAAAAVGRLSLGRLGDVQHRLLLRVAAASPAPAPLTRRLGPALVAEIVVDVGPAVLTPTTDLVDSWGRTPATLWAIARHNSRVAVRPAIRLHRVHDLVVAVCAGPRTSGIVADPVHIAHRCGVAPAVAARLRCLSVIGPGLAVLVGSLDDGRPVRSRAWRLLAGWPDRPAGSLPPNLLGPAAGGPIPAWVDVQGSFQ